MFVVCQGGCMRPPCAVHRNRTRSPTEMHKCCPKRNPCLERDVGLPAAGRRCTEEAADRHRAQSDRADRDPRRHPLGARAAQDEKREDHAPRPAQDRAQVRCRGGLSRLPPQRVSARAAPHAPPRRERSCQHTNNPPPDTCQTREEDQLGDTSTLSDPGVVAKLIELRGK